MQSFSYFLDFTNFGHADESAFPTFLLLQILTWGAFHSQEDADAASFRAKPRRAAAAKKTTYVLSDDEEDDDESSPVKKPAAAKKSVPARKALEDSDGKLPYRKAFFDCVQDLSILVCSE